MKVVNFSEVPNGSIVTFDHCVNYYMKTESVAKNIRGIVNLSTGRYISENLIRDKFWRNTYLVAENLEQFLRNEDNNDDN